jgi:4-aminobutyrate aminotransferase-like enzyme
MGKPLGNGFPIAAVVTTREIADAFDNGMKYFNTFGGNPVACAVGLAVLDVVRDDGLQSEAKDVGEYFMNSLLELQRHHQIIGDIRGRGLYLGIDLVSDRISRHPATARAMQISEQMKDIGVITYAAGTADNVLKVKPPMVFQRRHVDLFVDRLDGVLRSCVDDH